MNETATHTDGWFDSLRRTSESLLALIRSRFELFAVELQEEKLRLINLLLWLGIAMTLGAAGLLVGMGALAVWLWNRAGYAGLIVLALAALAVAAGILLDVRHRINRGPPPFAGTVAEFRKDSECLRKD
ncbi:MAG: phage holin family protein [Verrucomicrobiota bacterium]|jgi:uncharacterized membrane protein YqjE